MNGAFSARLLGRRKCNVRFALLPHLIRRHREFPPFIRHGDLLSYHLAKSSEETEQTRCPFLLPVLPPRLENMKIDPSHAAVRSMWSGR